MKRDPSTKAEGIICHACLPLWDRTGNVKAVQLCRLHAHANELMTYTKNYHQELIAKKLGHKDRTNCCSVTKAIAKAEEK